MNTKTINRIISAIKEEEGIEIANQSCIEKFIEDIEKEKVHVFEKNEAVDLITAPLQYFIDNNDMDGLAKMLSHHFFANVRIENSKIYKNGEEVCTFL